MAKRATNPDFVNGVPELLVLRLLADRPMHGYDVVQAIRAASHGQLQFGEGCIYPVLHRLEAEGVLRGKRVTFNGRQRVVYHLSPAGKRRLADSAQRWQQLVCAVSRILQGSTDGTEALLGSAAE